MSARIKTDEEALQPVRAMSEALQCIETSANQSARIVKAIDEVTVQTRLLAHNAAREAGRAAEADRCLAMMAAELRRGAEQVRLAVSGSGQRVYPNALGVEFPSVANERLAAQGREMRTTVQELVTMVQGIRHVLRRNTHAASATAQVAEVSTQSVATHVVEQSARAQLNESLAV